MPLIDHSRPYVPLSRARENIRLLNWLSSTDNYREQLMIVKSFVASRIIISYSVCLYFAQCSMWRWWEVGFSSRCYSRIVYKQCVYVYSRAEPFGACRLWPRRRWRNSARVFFMPCSSFHISLRDHRRIFLESLSTITFSLIAFCSRNAIQSSLVSRWIVDENAIRICALMADTGTMMVD